jgi:hypothetical protein
MPSKESEKYFSYRYKLLAMVILATLIWMLSPYIGKSQTIVWTDTAGCIRGEEDSSLVILFMTDTCESEQIHVFMRRGKRGPFLGGGWVSQENSAFFWSCKGARLVWEDPDAVSKKDKYVLLKEYR